MSRPAIAALLLAALLAPHAVASWGGPGGAEPDTALDAPHAFPDANVGPDLRVYFDAYAAPVGTSDNPNLAATGSRVELPGQVEYRALLGFWRDCNRDGYVGMAEAAVQDYRAELLPHDTPCPPGSWFNDGQWVSEMIAIGAVDPCEYDRSVEGCGGVDAFHVNERVLYANGTRVWGDEGRPSDGLPPRCPVAPLPRGTTSGTGALLRYADCHDGRALARAVALVDPDGSLGLRFDPENPQESGSHLNQHLPVNLFGNPTTGQRGVFEAGTGRPAATAWDCHAPATSVRDPTAPQGERGLLSQAVVPDPTGGALDGKRFPFVIVVAATGAPWFQDGALRVDLADEHGAYARVPALAPAVDPQGSAWDAAEAALDGPAGDCDAATPSRLADLHPGGAVERGDAPARVGARDRSDFVLTFYDGHRGIRDDLDPHTGPLTPSDGGLLLQRHGRGGAGPLWTAMQPALQDPQLVDRHQSGPAPARHVTFYARLGADATAIAVLPPTAGGTYGADACPLVGPGQPERDGWACDPTVWWRDADGRDLTPRYANGDALGQVPGASWHLRDVDCHDGQLAHGVDAHASLVGIHEEGACDRPPGAGFIPA